jgi:hypothetical protein
VRPHAPPGSTPVGCSIFVPDEKPLRVFQKSAWTLIEIIFYKMYLFHLYSSTAIIDKFVPIFHTVPDTYMYLTHLSVIDKTMSAEQSNACHCIS